MDSFQLMISTLKLKLLNEKTSKADRQKKLTAMRRILIGIQILLFSGLRQESRTGQKMTELMIAVMMTVPHLATQIWRLIRTWKKTAMMMMMQMWPTLRAGSTLAISNTPIFSHHLLEKSLPKNHDHFQRRNRRI